MLQGSGEVSNAADMHRKRYEAQQEDSQDEQELKQIESAIKNRPSKAN